MPRTAIEDGAVVVRVSYSLVSVGTEVASLGALVDTDSAPIDKGKAYARLAWTYLGKAVRDPEKAAQRLLPSRNRPCQQSGSRCLAPPARDTIDPGRRPWP